MAGQTNGSGPGHDDDRKLFVGGLGRNLSEQDVKDYFSKYGEVESVNIKVDQYTGQSRGFAFVTFKNSKVIDELLAAGTHYIGNKKIDPKKVTKKQLPLNCKIFVGGLTAEMTDSIVQDYFSQYGTIVEYQAPMDKKKKQRKGFCFITFESKDIVHKVLKSPKQTINGKSVDVKKVKFNPETMGTGFHAAGKAGMYPVYGFGQQGYPPAAAYAGGYGYDGYENYYGGYADYGYAPYGGNGYGFQGYGVISGAAPTAAGGGKFRENQYQRHTPY